MSLKLVIFFSIFFSSFPISGKSIVNLNHVTSESGLPHNTVKAIVQDTQGIFWIGTHGGLVKYDGFEISNHTNIPPYGVLSLSIQNQDILWVGTTQGLFRLDIKSGISKQFKFIESDKNTISSNFIYHLSIENEQTLWIGTNKGVDKLNLNNQNISRIFSVSDIKKSNRGGRINTILKNDKTDSIFIGGSGGLIEYSNERTKKINFPNHSNIYVSSMLRISTQNVLVGTNHGLYLYSLINNKIVPFMETLKGYSISSIVLGKSNQYWVGTYNNGLFEISNKKIINHFKKVEKNKNSLSDNSINSILVDFNGSVLIGTTNKGLNWFNPNSQSFGLFNNSSSELSCMNTTPIHSVIENINGDIILGSPSGPVTTNFSENKCELYSTSPSQTSRTVYNGLIKLFIDSNSALWMGSDSGLSIKQKNSDSFKKLYELFPAINVFDIFEDKSENIYIAAIDGVYKRKSKQVHFEKLQTLKNNNVVAYKLLRDSSGKLLVGALDGLYRLENNMLIKHNILPTMYQDSPIVTMLNDSNKNVWIGVDHGGLFKVDSSENITNITKNDSSNKLKNIIEFRSILEANNGDIWIGSKTGLTKISSANEIVNYHTADGLQGEIFFPNSALIDSSDNVFFGGTNGLNIFKTSEIKKSSIPPIVSINKLFLFNKELTVDDTIDDDRVSNIAYRKDLTLSYRNHVIGFEFTSVHLAAPKRNQFAYMLENYEDTWNYTGYKYRRATYTNLPAGKYVFNVKSANNHGVWSAPKKLKVTILPPWWKTPIAYFSYSILTILIVYTVVHYRTFKLKQHSRRLELEVKERTNEINRLLSQKNAEFANISHEFRTPLTLILGPATQLLEENITRRQKKKLKIIQRNGYRILRMVDQLLNMETFRVKSDSQKSLIAFGKIIENLGEAFASLALEKKITFVVKNIQQAYFEVTPSAFEKILLNLLSNAFKYTPTGGTITLESYRIESNYIVKVSDTGIGISKHMHEKIFERFSRVLDENSEQVTGAGIGLSLVKSLVESHGGSIFLESELGKGSCFTITLPIINEITEIEVKENTNDEIVKMELMSLSTQTASNDRLALDTRELGGDKPSVLVIEDNMDLYNYILESIRSDYNVLAAPNGTVGVELAIKHVPDLIVSDIMMPKMDGFEVTNALRENEITNHIPIILLTARGDRESRLRGWQEKADEYLTKPFDIDELKVRLDNLLNIRNILKKRYGESAFIENQSVLSAENESLDIDKNKSKQQLDFMQRLNDVIEPLYEETSTSVSQIAAGLAMSDRQFSRKLRSTLDMTPAEYLRRFRLEKARALLDEGKSANFTALEVGFSTHSYFGKCFKAQFGQSPSEYQKSNV